MLRLRASDPQGNDARARRSSSNVGPHQRSRRAVPDFRPAEILRLCPPAKPGKWLLLLSGKIERVSRAKSVITAPESLGATRTLLARWPAHEAIARVRGSTILATATLYSNGALPARRAAH
ncbi:MAG: hypothetical protein ABI613_10140 [Gemmatimonadota bacterium]